MVPEELSLLVRTKAAEVLGVSTDEVSEQTNLAEDFGVDSLELLEIATRVEQALSVRINAADIALARTVGHAAELLGEHLAADAGNAADPRPDATGRRTG